MPIPSAPQPIQFEEHPKRALIRLAWPMAISAISYSMMTVVDTLFVARIGSSALAGVALGGVLSFAFVTFGFGISRATKVQISQSLGAGDRQSIPALMGAGVAWAALIGTAIAFIGLGVRELIPYVSASDAASTHGQSYALIRFLAAPLVLLAANWREVQYAQSKARAPMVISIIANIANIGLDWLFIFGLDGGVSGAAWASLASAGLEACLLLSVTSNLTQGIRTFTRQHMLETWNLGLPIAFQHLLEVGAFAILTVLVSIMGEVDIAAHQIALQIVHFGFLPLNALGEATTIHGGLAVGANRDDLIIPLAKDSLLLATLFAVPIGAVFWFAGGPLAQVFTSDPHVVERATLVLCIAAGFQILDAGNAIGRSLLRGIGDVKFVAKASIISAWICTPPLTFIIGTHLGYGVVGGWIAITVEIAVIASLMWHRILRFRWKPFAEASRRRIRR